MAEETFERLAEFIENQMRMSHVYQPVMLRQLLADGGESTIEDIARAFLAEDRSQIDYYAQITKNMPGRVLRNHGLVERDGDRYRLVGVDDLTAEQVVGLMSLCQDRLDEYVEKRGERIWAHRGAPSRVLSGSLRYQVLKAARYRCQLCGVPAEERFLEVDHIIPVSRGGETALGNLQALCWQCNANKGNRDDTDFREVGEWWDERDPGCVFCTLPNGRIERENQLAVSILDAFPVTPLHLLVLPKRHVTSYSNLAAAELNLINRLVWDSQDWIRTQDGTVTGFNIGVNDGEDAGQTVGHCHVHVIPRRHRDMADPRGGVRGVIPTQQKYPDGG